MDDEYDQDGIKDENHYGNNEKGEELDPKNADGFEDDKNQDRVVHAEKWSKFCRLAESKENADPVPNLQVYLAAKKKRTDAIRKLETILENSMGEMKAVAASILNETLVKVHGKEQDEVESIERDVTTFFQSNDGRRKGLLKTMEFANKKWDKQYTAITDRILNVVSFATESVKSFERRLLVFRSIMVKHFSDTVRSPIHPTAQNFEADDDKLQAKPAAVIDETDDVSAESMTRTTEPDWHALAEYEPSRENVETFVGLLDKRQGATTELEDMLNDVRSQFEMVAGETFQAANESHHVTQAGCDDYERELELYMMANHKGRRNMRQLLIESEQRAQERFLKLRSRLAV